MLEKGGPDFWEDENGTLYFFDRICVLGNKTLRKQIVAEAHKSEYAIHLGEVKMYQHLRRAYWWPGMKKNMTQYVLTCLTC
jgi:hypothetical protein